MVYLDCLHYGFNAWASFKSRPSLGRLHYRAAGNISRIAPIVVLLTADRRTEAGPAILDIRKDGTEVKSCLNLN